jgi:DNA polymerase III subunit epsilon
MSLANQAVLLLDIQATAAASAGGVLLEVGWWPYPFEGSDGGIITRLVGHSSIALPQRLTRLTGLSKDDLLTGGRLIDIWEQLQHAAGQVAAARTDAADICPVVVHFARFEAPYLEKLRALAPASGGVNMDLICTNEITRRLLPGLPRKGLRAVAGYFGHDTPSQRRCLHHLRATAAIWKGIASELAAAHGITTITALKAWMRETPIPSKAKRTFQVPAASVAQLPRRPGVYRLLSRNGKCLYAGKAKDLHQRVRSYFQPRRQHAEHILEMLSIASDLKISPTRTALEAALLEHDLIKALAPPYNIALRPDDGGLEFWSRDFQHCSSRWSRHHPLGPLPVGESIAILGALARLLQNVNALDATIEIAELADLQQVIGALAPEAIEPALIREALLLFTKNHATPLSRRYPTHALLTIGRRLWMDRHLTPTADPQPAPDPAPFEPDEDDGTVVAPIWHPEAICRLLENVICHQAALLRRSRWLALLGNATLIWSSPHSSTQRRIVFRKGRVAARDNGLTTSSKSWGRSRLHQRWRPTDKVTYDRLRVATTELRRLVQEKRALTIRLDRSGNDLHRGQVARRLHWF